eukprot:CAMPEP_0114329946 /NCGR_PEP_ID=MMETSP0101-20121206/1408_1 /TAXON_ID=38822 ORGANISM="Pteridomonas danica, Strain PT" /NCGR_SAMPLE_ID=MMETSP0101 /ASSEMBLY_ACC=CAM_ASM_000211 /LENGTH=224 /DNA_ID=CAMNT_0001459763 /DNA_START=507 /DNA_END=1182 /DNA_ORIENTATION=-
MNMINQTIQFPDIKKTTNNISKGQEEQQVNENDIITKEDEEGMVLPVEERPIRENSKLWIKFKSDSNGGRYNGIESKAKRVDDNEMKFLWGSTENIQKEEDAKREEYLQNKLNYEFRLQSKRSQSVNLPIISSSSSSSSSSIGSVSSAYSNSRRRSVLSMSGGGSIDSSPAHSPAHSSAKATSPGPFLAHAFHPIQVMNIQEEEELVLKSLNLLNYQIINIKTI